MWSILPEGRDQFTNWWQSQCWEVWEEQGKFPQLLERLPCLTLRVELHGLTQSHYSHLLPSNLAHNRCKVLLRNEEPFAEVKSNLSKSPYILPHFHSVINPCSEFQLALENTSLLSCLTLLQKSLLLPPIAALGAIFNDDVWVSFSSAVLWGGGQTCDTASMCINSKL